MDERKMTPSEQALFLKATFDLYNEEVPFFSPGSLVMWKPGLKSIGPDYWCPMLVIGDVERSGYRDPGYEFALKVAVVGDDQDFLRLSIDPRRVMPFEARDKN